MGLNSATFMGADATRIPSGSIWGDCPLGTGRTNEANDVNGFFQRIDFAQFRTTTNVNAAFAHWQDGIGVFGSDGAPLAAVDAVGGGITVSSDGDNEGTSIAANFVAPFQIIQGGGALWFECRVKFSSIANTLHGDFIGLIEVVAPTAITPITAAGALADQNLVGFFRPEGTGAVIATVYKANGIAAVTVQTPAVVPVADTWVKLGMKFVPVGDKVGSNVLKFYADGVLLSSYKIIPSAAGTDFPNDVRLGFIATLLNATATTPGSTSYQWAQIAQLYAPGAGT